MVQPAEDWVAKNVPGPLDGAQNSSMIMIVFFLGAPISLASKEIELSALVEAPEFFYGDTAANPSPTPNESSTSVMANDAVAPAAMAVHDNPMQRAPRQQPAYRSKLLGSFALFEVR